MGAKSVVLVTGANSGLGRCIAETLARGGHTVFAGVRESDGKNRGSADEMRRLAETGKLPLAVVPLDVTRDADAEAAVKTILGKAGRIDVLVNNAGVGAFGVTEGYTPDQAQALFAVNVLGMLRMNRAVLPAMRAAKHGLLLHISTSASRATMPFMGPYYASKVAAETIAEEARFVLGPLGIDSAIIQASIYPTPMMQKMMQPADGARVGGYGPVMPVMGALGKGMEYMLSLKPNPQDVGDAVLKLVEASPGTRPLRTLVGNIHPPGVKEFNAAGERMIADFYKSMSIADLLKPNYGP